MNMELLGQTTAKLMDSIENDPPGEGGENELVAVGIVVVLSDGSQTFTRTFCSVTRHFEQIGLFEVGLDCAKNGE